jgi:hypothetical protein
MRMNAVMVRTFGFSAAVEGAMPTANKRVPNNAACDINCEMDADEPLFRNIIFSSILRA